MTPEDVIRKAIRDWKSDATIHETTDLGGLLHETYAVSLSDRDVVCSLWETDQSIDDFWKEVRLSEFLNERTAIPAPAVLHSDASLDAVGYWYYITDRVAGDALGDALQSLSKTELRRLSRETGRLLGRIHSVAQFDRAGEIEVADEPTVKDGEPWRDYVRSIYDAQIEGLSESRFSDLRETARDVFEDNLDRIEPREFRLLHGDYTPANLVVREGQIQAVIDFEQAISGPPEFELAGTELHLMDQAALFPNPFVVDGQRRRELRETFREGYRTVAKLDPSWKHRVACYKFLTVIDVMATFEWRAQQHDTSTSEREAQEEQLRRSFLEFAAPLD